MQSPRGGAKYADALRRISFARRSSRFSRSSALSRSPSALVSPGRTPSSRSAWRTHLRSVSAEQPIFDDTEPMAAHCDSCAPWWSRTNRTARSRSSGEYLFECFIAPVSQGLEPPGNPGQFSPPSVHISDRARGLPENMLDAWIQSRVDARSSQTRLRNRVSLPQWTPDMGSDDHQNGIQLLRFRDVMEQVGLRSSQIYRLIEARRFPAPVPLTEGARRWVSHEIEEWLGGRIALSLRISGRLGRRRPELGDSDRRSL